MRIVFSLVAFCLLLTASPASAACTFDATATWSVPVSDIYKAHNGPYENAFSKNVTMPADSVRLVTEVTVTPPGCYYSETALPAWFGSMSTSGGYEGGKMTRIIPANTSNAPRTGIYTVAGININVTQLPSCNFCSGSSTHPRECQYIACESTSVWKRCPSSNCDTAGYTSGVKIKDNTKNVLFDQDYNYGMARFVSNKTGTDIFVPQNTKDEFASFLDSDLFKSRKKGNIYAIDWGFAIRDNAAVPFSGGAKDYAGCPATSFSSVGGGTIAVPGAVAESITVPYDEERVRVSANGYSYTKQPLNPLNHAVKPTPLSVVLGSADVNSPIKFSYDRINYDGDCITDNQGTRNCPPAGAVVFTQYNKVIFKAKEITPSNNFSYRGITFKNYGWAVAEENPVQDSVLYVKVNNGANTPVSDCTAGYPEAAPPINGQCGTAMTDALALTVKPVATPPSTVLCAKGNASIVSGNGPWTWTCAGVGTGATNANCSAGATGCPAGTAVSWSSGSYNCTATTTSATSSGSTTSVTATGTNTGNAIFLCMAGGLTVQSGATCNAGASCPYVIRYWEQGGAWGGGSYVDVCSTNLPITTSGTSRTVTYSSSPVIGSATYTCNNGTWTGPTSASCGRSAPCPAGTVSWGSCSGPIGSAYSGNSWGVTSNNGNIGNANYDCSGSTWVLRAGSDCSAPATTCPAGTKTWTSGSTCTGNIAETSINSYADASTPVGSANSGSAHYLCQSGGTWFGPITATCGAASCPQTNVSWGAGNKCFATLPASPNGPKNVSYSSGNTTGSATYTCSGSTWSGPAGGSTCTTSCPLTDPVSWTGATGVQCTGKALAAASNTYQIVSPTNGKVGSAKYTCNEGSWVVSETTCNNAPAACGSANNTYSATTPTALCSSGAASAVTGGTGATPFSWTCGGTVNCSTRAPQQCTKFYFSSGNYTVPSDVLLGGNYTIEYKLKGGGGGGAGTGGSTGAPGGGGGSTAISINGGGYVVARGGMGGGSGVYGDGGETQFPGETTERFTSWGSVARNFALIVGGGGGAGGTGSSHGGGGGGGAGLTGGGGGAACVKNDGYHGGGGNGTSVSGGYGGQGVAGQGTIDAYDGFAASGGAGGKGGTCATYGTGGNGGSGSTGGSAGTTANGGSGGGGGGAQGGFGGNSGNSGTTTAGGSSYSAAGRANHPIVDQDTAVGLGQGGKPGGAKFFYWAPSCTW